MELDKATYGPIAKTFLTACRKGHIEVVQAQLRHENPTVAPRLLGQKDMDGYTGLHKAAYNGHLAVVELLIASGADVNVGTKDNWRPLHCAARWNKAHIIECLLGHGADINAQTNGGLTAMHIAATYGDTRDALLVLIHHPGYDISLKTAQGDNVIDALEKGIHRDLAPVAANTKQ